MKKEITRKELIREMVYEARNLKRLHDKTPVSFSYSYCCNRLFTMSSLLFYIDVLSCDDKVFFDRIITRIFTCS